MELVGASGGLVMPPFSIQIALSGTYWAPSNWTDITKYVRSFSVTRGRQHELQLVQPGQLELQLVNQDGRFSPWNTNGPYAIGGSLSSANGLVPSTPIKITATWGGTTYPVFAGAVDSWVPTYGQVLATQVVKASDALKIITTTTIDNSSYSGEVIGNGAALYWRLGDPIWSATAADSSAGFSPSGTPSMIWSDPTYGHWASYVWASSGSAGTISGNVTFGNSGGLALDYTTSAGFGSAYGQIIGQLAAVPTSLTVEFLLRVSTPGAGTQTVATIDGMSIGYDLTSGAINVTFAGGATVTAGSGSVLGGGWHHVAVTYINGTGAVNIYLDGTLVYVGTGTAGKVTAGFVVVGGAVVSGTFWMQEFAVFPSVLTSLQVLTDAVLSVAGFVTQQSGQMIRSLLLANGVPASALGTIATGISQTQPPPVSIGQSQLLSVIQLAEKTEQGILFVDESGLIQFYDRHYGILNTNATVSNGIFASDNDPTHYHFLPTALQPGTDGIDLWNIVPVQRQGGVLQAAYNYSSTTQFGRRTLTGYTGMMQTTDADAANLGWWLVNKYSEPLTRFRQVTVDNTADHGNNMTQMLGRKLLDRITLNWQPLDGSASPLVQDSLIEKITHKVTPEKWETTWALSPADAVDQVMVWDDTVLGFWDKFVWAF